MTHKNQEEIMFRRGLLMASLCLSYQSAVAQKHVHGEGQLLIAQEQQKWQFQFLLPATDLLGFEHIPDSVEQRQQLKNIVSKIESVEEMIRLPTYCTLVSMTHSLADFAARSLSSTHAHSHKQETATHGNHGHLGEHLDVNFTYIFNCKEDPDSAEVSVLDWVSSLETLDTQWITNNQQGAAQLKPSSNIVRFAK